MTEAVSVRSFRRVPEWLGIMGLIGLALVVDSAQLAARFAYGQWCANILVVAAFFVILRGAPPRLRGIMWWGLVVGTGGEVVFSLFVGMYEYRLENIPVYVPPGHSLLYAAVFYFVREPYVRQHAANVAKVMLGLCIAYALYWLVAHRDVYGFVCTALFGYLIWRHKTSRMFFLAMYLLVAYLEQVGTRLECWYWHPHLLDKFEWMPSGNPPSGISVFYFGFDAACLEYAARTSGAWPRYLRLKKRARERARATESEPLASPA